MVDARREQRAAHELNQVVVAQIAHHYAGVLWLGKRRADAQADGFNAEAIEIVARQGLAEALGDGIKAIRAQRYIDADGFGLPIKADDMARARINDAPDLMPVRSLIDVIEPDDIRPHELLEWRLEGDSPEVQHRIDAFEQRMHRGGVLEVREHDFLAAAGARQSTRSDTRATRAHCRRC